eukprot:m.11456 g.11456  ORF g.11456 m.11456 type:complete len:62 (-) comp5723_c0_seq1:299-484(-)
MPLCTSSTLATLPVCRDTQVARRPHQCNTHTTPHFFAATLSTDANDNITCTQVVGESILMR